MVLKGVARLRFEDEIIEMMPGDSVHIPAHKKHRVEWTASDEPTIWLTVYYGDPRCATTPESIQSRNDDDVARLGEANTLTLDARGF